MELLSGVTYMAHMDFIASYSVDFSIKGWIGASLGLFLCDCDAYTNLLTALVLPTTGNLTLCVPCIILQCFNDQRDAQFL